MPNPASVLVLGGSFDPIHLGHLALAQRFMALLKPEQLRIIPAGQPWQKSGLIASAEQRLEMVKLAFSDLAIPVVIDEQEVFRAQQRQASYSIDTLRQLRQELGAQCVIYLAIGADQLQNLTSWRDWKQLFDYAHICAATRPGFDIAHLSPTLLAEWQPRLGTAAELAQRPAGKSFLDTDLAEDISATEIRRQLQQATYTKTLVSPKVLDYIQQHHLYR